MTVDTAPEVATAIAELSTAWNVYANAEQTLDGPRPDPAALLAASGKLRAQMPDADPVTGALPWESDPDLDPVAPEGPPWVDAAFEVLYEIHVLSSGTGLTNQAYHLLELSNAVSDLTSWHPGYDGERGEIVPANES